MLGIKETKEALDLGLAIQASLSASLSDGKIDWRDIGNLLPLVRAIGKGIEDISLVKDEIKDLTTDEEQELLDYVRDRFDLSDDELELLIEDTLRQVLYNYQITMRWANRGKEA